MESVSSDCVKGTNEDEKGNANDPIMKKSEVYDLTYNCNADDDDEHDETYNFPDLVSKSSDVFVKLNEITQIVKAKCQEINELLGISGEDYDNALILMNHFKWRQELIGSEWFGNEDKISVLAGLEPQQIVILDNSPQIVCPMCFEQKTKEEINNLKCNHQICKDCWREYIVFNITRSEHVFFWKCPFAGCNMIVPESFNQKYIDPAQLSHYYKKMAIAYSYTNKSLRWCPSPNCEYAVEVESMAAKEVFCNCGYVFCFKCGLEDHSPCDCEIAEEWIKIFENNGDISTNQNQEKETTTDIWLFFNTKCCPKCGIHIQKNQGCNLMRCGRPGCGHQFCWLCLENWETHNSDHYTCNKLSNFKIKEPRYADDDDKKNQMFYYERFFNSNLAIKMINQRVKNIEQDQRDLSLIGLEFLNQAFKVLRNSKRLLKWSYVYGFYIKNDVKRNLYEIIQEKLDLFSFELHGLLEIEYNAQDFEKCKPNIWTACFKCQKAAESFLINMEDFSDDPLCGYGCDKENRFL